MARRGVYLTGSKNDPVCCRYRIYFHRSACGIDVPGSDFVITGGENTPEQGERVVRYTPQGAATLLPSLQEARWGHGCGYYYDQNNMLVSLKSFNKKYFEKTKTTLIQN